MAGTVARLTRARIADAVVAVGFDRASVTAVADHLGVQHGALYRHVTDREDMMRDALALATGRYEWPAFVGDWREAVWAESRAWWAFCGAHPGFVAVLASTPGMPAPMSRRSLLLASHLSGLGVPPEDALLVVDLVVDTIHDIFHRADQRDGVIEGALSMSVEDAAALVDGVSDDVLEVVAGALIDDPWPWFARKVELVLAGVATRMR